VKVYLVAMVILFTGTSLVDGVPWYWRLIPATIALVAAIILGMALENAHPSPPNGRTAP